MKKLKLTQKYLVLVPHRDVRVTLQKYSENLIKNGLKGVYKFPLIAPLAELSQSLTDEELKNTACLLRENIGVNIIYTKETNMVPFSENPGTSVTEGEAWSLRPLALFGPRLELEIPPDLFCDNLKIKRLFSPLTIGTFLIPDSGKDNQHLIAMNQKFDEPLQEKLKFRAAAIANMYWRSMQIDGEISYKWKIGKLCWLPKKTI